MSKSQKIALVTGVGKETGLGFAICKELQSLGMTVYLTARHLEQATQLSALLDAESNPGIVPLAVDISDPADIATNAELIAERHGHLDVLINNAASMSPYGETAAEADLPSGPERVRCQPIRHVGDVPSSTAIAAQKPGGAHCQRIERCGVPWRSCLRSYDRQSNGNELCCLEGGTECAHRQIRSRRIRRNNQNQRCLPRLHRNLRRRRGHGCKTPI